MDPGRLSLSQLRDRFAFGSVRTRLLVLFTAVIGAISVFIFLFFPATMGEQALDGLRDKAQGIADMAAYSLSPAVAFEDQAGMEETLAAVLENNDVVHVEVLDSDGGVLAARSGRETSGSAQELPDQDVLTQTTPVTFPETEEPIGEIRLEMSLRSVHADVSRTRGIVALVSFAVFLLGILSVVVIAGLVTAPLREVAATAERVAGGDLTSRAPETSRDEVGQLAATFNHMVGRLQSAHRQVEVARAMLEQVLDNLPADVTMFDPEGRYLYVNPEVADNASQREWIIGRTPLEFAARAGQSAEAGQPTMDAIAECVSEGRVVVREVVVPDGEEAERHFVRTYSPIVNGASTVSRVIAHGVDISDLRIAEAELRDTQERLLQSQKMESIGRLAGGVAHDFNNLLTTMAGNAELLLLEADLDPSSRDLVDEITDASTRAAALTQQLLAFSRKQVTQPRVLNVNTTIAGTERMLRRLIGEDVELATEFGEPLDNVRADPGQLEQVIVNLAVNSRDAMPLGGTLVIGTSNLALDAEYRGAFDESMPAGRYVQIMVSDTGTGMDKATLRRIFEPFFTKKDIGKGTGLGLATVYGIVQQAGGYIRVYSEPGFGTTFKIFLPSVDAHVDPVRTGRHRAQLVPGTETVLVAEDQEGVRTMTGRVLQRCGYNVLSAPGPLEALQIAANYDDHIHLLLTDVVMPSMSGPELAEELSHARPDTAVVFMSGYTDDQLQHHGVLDEGVVLVQKPFTAVGLSQALRAVLDRSNAAA